MVEPMSNLGIPASQAVLTPRIQRIADSETSRADAPSSPKEVTTDQELLDAYSRAVIQVVDTVSLAVVNIGVGRATPRGEQSGAGSGVVIAPDGYIVTNSHVVHGASRLTIAFTDGSMRAATVVGTDPP